MDIQKKSSMNTSVSDMVTNYMVNQVVKPIARAVFGDYEAMARLDNYMDNIKYQTSLVTATPKTYMGRELYFK